MKKINAQEALHLFDVAQTRQLETLAKAQISDSPPLMQRAGLAIAQLAMAIKPFAACHWIFCGPGNNGGDGLEAATHLHLWGQKVCVVLWQPHQLRPVDAQLALQKVRSLGIELRSELDFKQHIQSADLVIDALLGIGLRTQADHADQANQSKAVKSDHPPHIQTWIAAAYGTNADVLAVDIPSGLNANTGNFDDALLQNAPSCSTLHATHTLQLLNAKPGCFTAHGRDACGTQWLDTLGIDSVPHGLTSVARLNTLPLSNLKHLHASHKGTFGDVTVVGGESVQARGLGMTGAVDLATSAALHAGAGRVMACYLSNHVPPGLQTEVMLRSFEALELKQGVVVCGCGGGLAIQKVLPKVLQESTQLVLDADALNAIAKDPWLQDLMRQRGLKKMATIITPHPLEAARLLNTDTLDLAQELRQLSPTDRA